MTMHASELAKKMLEGEELQRAADNIRGEIQAAVLDIGKTQTVGNVRASYSKGRKSYDYQRAAQDVSPSIIRANSTTRTIVDWRGICQNEGITDIPFTQSEPRVTVKLLREAA